MPEPKLAPPFAMHAAAFLDVLGFKNLVKAAQTTDSGLKELFGLLSIIQNHVDFDNQSIAASVPKELHPKYLFVSDSIILTVPLEHDGYDGLSIVGIKCIQIAQRLLEHGFAVRGAINVGPVLHDKANIFGSGYSDTYKAQEEDAIHPRIILTEAAEKHYEKARHRGVLVTDLQLWVNYEKKPVLDIFHPSYFRGMEGYGSEGNVFHHLESRIHHHLTKLPLGSDARSKWEWLAGFYNEALNRHKVGGPAQRFQTLPVP